MHEITSVKEWKEALKKHDKVVIDIYGVNCPPCKRIAPDVEKMAKINQKTVQFYKCNIDQEALDKLIRGYNIGSVPTFLFFYKGQWLKGLRVNGADLDAVCKSLESLLRM